VASTTQREPPSPRKSDLNQVAKGEAFKVIVIGNSGVGKTRFTHLYCMNTLPPLSKAETIGVEMYNKAI
jgi:GTPase SAR1 family protein